MGDTRLLRLQQALYPVLLYLVLVAGGACEGHEPVAGVVVTGAVGAHRNAFKSTHLQNGDRQVARGSRWSVFKHSFWYSIGETVVGRCWECHFF